MSRVAWDGQAVGDFSFRFLGLVLSVLEAEAVITGLYDVAMMGKAVEQRGGHFGVAEYAGPLAEAEVGGGDDADALVKLGEQGGRARRRQRS